MDGERRGAGILADVAEFLGRQCAVEWLDVGSGRIQVGSGDRLVQLELPPALVDEYAEQLDDGSIPGLSSAVPEQQDRVRAKYLAIWIDELLGSDLNESLRWVVLHRGMNGRLFLDGVYDTAVPPWVAPAAEGATWTADRPDVGAPPDL